MSIEAIAWALNDAPIPRDKRNASTLAVVLIGLANHADPQGRNTFPAISTLVRYTRLSERSVQYALRELEELELISPSDPEIVRAYVKRADRRPQGWDLATAGCNHCTPQTSTECKPGATGCKQRRHGVHTLHPNHP